MNFIVGHKVKDSVKISQKHVWKRCADVAIDWNCAVIGRKSLFNFANYDYWRVIVEICVVGQVRDMATKYVLLKQTGICTPGIRNLQNLYGDNVPRRKCPMHANSHTSSRILPEVDSIS